MNNQKQEGEAAVNPMWGGHFTGGPAEAFARINPSIAIDKRLYAQDITGSVAHCAMLVAQNIITQEEGTQITEGLVQIQSEIESGAFSFDAALEDIHMNIEARLREMIGDVAGKLHTARSRNDQVVTDFRLWVRQAYSDLDILLKATQAALLVRAEEHAATIMPGFTHLQSAQPVTLGHHLLAYVEMLGRDRSRMADAKTRMNQCPLGATALAGTSFAIDRDATSTALGFDAPMANSLDAVSDRDFALEFLSCASLTMIHLTRLAEEFILWSTPQFGFVSFSDAFTSGSSIMPQKRNPDAAELVRAKAGRVVGNLHGLLTTMKALPLAYNKDTQEDKEPVFEAYDQLSLCVLAMTGMVEDFAANKEAMHAAASSGYSTATDLADWLVRTLAMPFRDAHHVTGRIVKIAEKQNCQLDALTLEAMQQIEPRITKAVFDVLSVDASVASRMSYGGTAPANVSAAVKAARERFL